MCSTAKDIIVRRRMERWPPGRLFLLYTLPQVGSMLLVAAQSIADGLIVGRLIGAEALAAVSIVMPFYALITAIALIIGTGTQAQVSIHLGMGAASEAKSDIISGLAGLLAFTALATAVVNVFPRRIAGILGADPSVMPLALDYMAGVMPWLVCIGAVIFLDFVLKALGHPRLAIGLFFAMCLCNLILSFCFVYYCGLSTYGVGLGTGLSYAGASVAYAVCVLRAMGPVARAKGRFRAPVLAAIAYNGSSEGLAEISVGISMFVYNITLMKYVGPRGVAAFSVVDIMMYVGTSVLAGVSNGLIPVIGYCWGAKLYNRIRAMCRLCVGVNAAAALGLTALIFWGADGAAAFIVGPHRQELCALAAGGARLVSLGFVLSGFNIFTASCYTALDRPGYSLLIAAMRGLVFLSAGILLLPPLLGVDGIWLAAPCAELLTFVAALYFVLARNPLPSPR